VYTTTQIIPYKQGPRIYWLQAGFSDLRTNNFNTAIVSQSLLVIYYIDY